MRNSPLKMILFPFIIIGIALLATKWDFIMDLFKSKNLHLVEAHMQKSPEQLIRETKIPPGGVSGPSIPLTVFRKDGGASATSGTSAPTQSAPSVEEIEQDIEQAKLFFMMGKEFEEQENYTGALEAYARVIKLDTNHAEAFFRHGRIAYDLTSREVGIASLRQAVELDGRNNDYRTTLARRLALSKEPEEALKHVQEVLRRDPSNREANNLIDILSR